MGRKRISKSTLSMFLRTKCDRELYLSLHEDSELDANGMPAPLQARPGIGVLQTAGRDFEDERNDQLIQSFGSLVMYQPDKQSQVLLEARRRDVHRQPKQKRCRKKDHQRVQ